jgi:hypothetical protein
MLLDFLQILVGELKMTGGTAPEQSGDNHHFNLL